MFAIWLWTAARFTRLHLFSASSSLKLLANLRLVPLGQRAENLAYQRAGRVSTRVHEFLSAIGGIHQDTFLLALPEEKLCDDHVTRNTVHALDDDCVKHTPTAQREQFLHQRTVKELVTARLLLLKKSDDTPTPSLSEFTTGIFLTRKPVAVGLRRRGHPKIGKNAFHCRSRVKTMGFCLVGRRSKRKMKLRATVGSTAIRKPTIATQGPTVMNLRGKRRRIDRAIGHCPELRGMPCAMSFFVT